MNIKVKFIKLEDAYETLSIENAELRKMSYCSHIVNLLMYVVHIHHKGWGLES